MSDNINVEVKRKNPSIPPKNLRQLTKQVAEIEGTIDDINESVEEAEQDVHEIKTAIDNSNDFTIRNGKMVRKNKAYNPAQYSGLGEIYLEKNNTFLGREFDEFVVNVEVSDPTAIAETFDGLVYDRHRKEFLVYELVDGERVYYAEWIKFDKWESTDDYVPEAGYDFICEADDKAYRWTEETTPDLIETEAHYGNVLKQEMVNLSNTIYHIQYDYDLIGKEINIPEGCVLQFEGGSLRNGIIVGQFTSIKAEQVNIFKSNIIIDGAWNNSIVYSEWIDIDLSGDIDNYSKFTSLINLVNNSSGTLKIQEGTIVTSRIKTKDNITIEGCGDSTIIKQYSNVSLYLCPIEVSRADNVTIRNLSIDGNYPNLAIDNSRHSIYVLNSKNTLIENVNIYNSCDAIMLGYSENPTSQVIIRNSYFHDCYRNTLVFAHCEDVIVENCICKGYKEYSALVDFEKHSDGDIHKNIVLNGCKFIKSTETSTGQPGYDRPQYIKLTTNGKTGDCTNIVFDNCDIQDGVQLTNFYNVSFRNCKIHQIEGYGASNLIIDSCYNDASLSSGTILNIYSDTGSNESKNVCITNCKFIYPSSSNVNGIAIMQVENVNVINTILINLNNAFTINYENSNITLCGCLIKGNKGGIKAVSNTYTKLFVIGCSIYDNKTIEDNVEVDKNYINLRSAETIKTAYENYKSDEVFGLKDLILHGKKSTSKLMEIYEDTNGQLRYKNSNNIVLNLGNRILGGDSVPGMPPYNLNSRYLDTRSNIWYDAVETYDGQGQHTYTYKFAPRVMITNIEPYGKPDFAGQFWISANPGVTHVYIAKGISDVSDWLQIV